MKTSRVPFRSTRNPLYLLLGVLLVLTVGLIAYGRYMAARQVVDPWTLVPDDAVVVLETSSSPDALRQLLHLDAWTSLLAAPGIRDVQEAIGLIDSVHNSPRQTLERFLTGKRLLLSLHPAADSGGGAAWLLGVPIQNVRQYRFLRTLAEDLRRSPQFAVSRREMGALIITQIARRTSSAQPVEGQSFETADSLARLTDEPLLAFVTYRNTLLASASATLLARVIDRLSHEGLRSPAATFASTDYLQVRGTYANVWVNFRQVPALLAPLLVPTSRPAFDEIASLCSEGLLGMEPQSGLLALRGFAEPEVAQGALAKSVGQQAPQPLRLWPVLSDRTGVLLHLGLGVPGTLRASARSAPPDSVEQQVGPLLDSLVATLHEEVALCLPAATGVRARAPADRLVYAYSPDPLRTVQALARLPGGRGRTEMFGGYVIRPVRVPELPQRLFGTLFAGFGANTQGVVALIGHYAVFAPNPATMRALLLDLAGGQTLTHEPATRELLLQGQKAATLSVYVQTANAWTLLQRALQPARRVEALRNEAVFRRFPQVLLQFARPEAGANRFYTTLLVQHANAVVGRPGSPAVAQMPTANSTFNHPLISAPVLVRGGSNGPAVIVQDAANILHGVDAAGREIWRDTLAGAWRDPVFRTPTGVGRPRVLLATAAQLYSLEAATGRSSANFPFYLSDSLRIQHFTAFAPDGSNYALLVDDPAGNLYGFDANGRAVPGWEPRNLGDALATAPRAAHLPDGADYIVVALRNGQIFALDRAAGVLPGFPVSAGTRLGPGCLAFEAGSSTRNSLISVVTAGGQLLSWDLRGEHARVRALPRPGGTAARYELVTVQNGLAGTEPTGRFVVSCQYKGHVALYDPATGTLLLDRSFLTAAPKEVQVWRLAGGGGTVYGLTERGPAKTYLFDERARPLANSVPFDSNGPVAVMFDPSTAEIVIWTAWQSTLRRHALRKPAKASGPPE